MARPHTRRRVGNNGRFEGFRPVMFQFLSELAQNNNKPWFDEHRSEYEAEVLGPVKAFVAELGPILHMLNEELETEAKVGRTISRINNDIRFHQSNSPLRQGSYRGLAATANHFARESHIDELAHAVNIDPLEFRLKNIKDDRLRDVLQAAAKTFGWSKSKPASGHGFKAANLVAHEFQLRPWPGDGLERTDQRTGGHLCLSFFAVGHGQKGGAGNSRSLGAVWPCLHFRWSVKRLTTGT